MFTSATLVNTGGTSSSYFVVDKGGKKKRWIVFIDSNEYMSLGSRCFSVHKTLRYVDGKGSKHAESYAQDHWGG
ncbi:hypothetical protein AC578_5019 [Pseudocercospora eumusae]|uniref:Uncharacterized protein n=1 Tax=Pseudocercospora eumusae TaxID=321146 RepID=A0A139H673_9PEZI|nr:hypothetical protein AC578_5019 [Pseudocercospora eumusae]